MQAEAIPIVPIEGGAGALHLVSGDYEGSVGPIHSLTGVFMSTVNLSVDARAELPAPHGRSVFLYVAQGSVAVVGREVGPWHLVRMNDDGDMVAVEAMTNAVLLFGHADPIGEPVVAHGPFVMNSREEISQAIRDYQAGKFNQDGELLEVGS